MLRKLAVRGYEWRVRRCLTTTSHTKTPLRVLFCGSDDFSIASLQALHRHSKTPNSNILSIDVAAKCDKPSGRGLKLLKSPLIKSAAKDLGLPFHQFNTFTGWNPPTYDQSEIPNINLVIAVSFGLLIPRRILNLAEFGGLNVHPSLLPQLRGAAPINWSIINGDTDTGVSIQTLHPTKFDEGLVLAQTPIVHIPAGISVDELRSQLAPMGGDLLVQAVQERLYLNPNSTVFKQESSLAPKITTQMKELQWQTDNLQTVLRKSRGMPKLWATASQSIEVRPRSPTLAGDVMKIDGGRPEFKQIRILFGNGLRAEEPNDIPTEIREHILTKIGPGTPFAVMRSGVDPRNTECPLLFVVRNEVLVIPRMQVAGSTEKPATIAASAADLMKELFRIDGYGVYVFHQALNTQF